MIARPYASGAGRPILPRLFIGPPIATQPHQRTDLLGRVHEKRLQIRPVWHVSSAHGRNRHAPRSGFPAVGGLASVLLNEIVTRDCSACCVWPLVQQNIGRTSQVSQLQQRQARP